MNTGTPSPMALADLANGWWKFKTLATGLELGVFEQMSNRGGCTVDEFSELYGFDERPAEMMLTACASLGLLEKSGDRYRNSAVAEEFLVPGKPYYFGAWVELCDHRAEAWGRLLDGLRHNRPTSWDPETGESLFGGDRSEMLRLFWQGMHSLSAYSAHQFARTVDMSGVKRLLDIGGCSGTYSVELCRWYPDLLTTIYDLPFILWTAEDRIASCGLQERVSTVAGDFFKDPELPEGHDAMLLSMILHDWDEASNRELLRRCFDALPSGGRLYISELLVNEEKTGPSDAALMSLNMLVETSGRNYTAAEYSSWLTETGFRDLELIPIESPGANGVIVARKP